MSHLTEIKRPRISAQVVLFLCAFFLAVGQDSLAEEAESLEKRFELVMPSETEELWRSVGWRTNLMEAREFAQQQNRPVFLWIMVGNPHGCT